MDIQNFSLADKPVGAVFTPLHWARWLVREFHVVSKWAKGATVCDPTAGQGVFVIALIDEAVQLGINVTEEMLERLFLIEREAKFIEDFHLAFRLKYDRDFPKQNTICTDVVLCNPKKKFDILVGNPHLNRIHHFNMLKEGSGRTLRFLMGLRREGFDISLNTYPQSKSQYRIITRLLAAKVRASHRYDNRGWWDGWLVNREIAQSYDQHSVSQNLALLDVIGAKPKCDRHVTQLFLSSDEIGWAKEYVDRNQLRDSVLVAFHVGSGTTKNLALRRWPLDYYRELIARLLNLRSNLKVLLLGGPEEQQDHRWLMEKVANPRLLVPETKNMKQAAGLLEFCDAFLSIDSALMHLAAAMQVPHQFVIETATFNKTIEPSAANGMRGSSGVRGGAVWSR